MVSREHVITRVSVIALLCVTLSVRPLHGATEITIKEFNNTENLTEIKIMSCHLPLMYELHVMDVPMTWMNAMSTCYDLGYQTIMNAMSNWLTRIQIKHYLESVGYRDSNYTFWTGVFRPYIHVTKWFSNWNNGGGCRLYNTNNVPRDNLTNGHCSVIDKASNTSSETTGIDECTNEHPFVCYRSQNGITYNMFKGFNVNNLTLGMAFIKTSEEVNITAAIVEANSTNMTDSNCTVEIGGANSTNTTYNSTCNCTAEIGGANSTNTTYINCTAPTNTTDNNSTATILEQCLAYCAAQDRNCNGVTYDTTNISSPRCLFITSSAWHYNITAQANMTHYAKSECNITMNNSYTAPIPNRTFGWFSSDCGVPEIPDAYLPCDPVAGGIPDSIVELAVEKKTTKKYERKFVSAEDNRPSAKSIGAFGIILILVFASVFPLFDVLVPKKLTKTTNRKRKPKSD